MGGVQSGMKTITTPTLFVGAGNMAHAIYSGARRAEVLDDSLVAVLNPSARRHELFPTCFRDAAEAVGWLGSVSRGGAMIVLAVKPQMLAAATEPLLGPLGELGFEALVVSILAGTRIEQIKAGFKNHARVVRVMPNTPAQVGLGMSAIAAGPDATGADIEMVTTLFAGVGETVTIGEESMDAFTALAGSGPAYLFYLAEAMMTAAEGMGLDRAQAGLIVRQTLLGSATLLSASAEGPGALRARVTSKNGTTYAATTTLDQRGVMGAIVDAVIAARDRGAEIARDG